MDIYYQLCMDKSIVFVWVKLVCRCKWTVLCSWNLFIVCSWNLLIMSFSKLSYRFLINFKIFCPHLSIFYILEFGVIRFRLLRCRILTKQKLIRVKTVRRVSDFFYPNMWPLESRSKYRYIRIRQGHKYNVPNIALDCCQCVKYINDKV